LAGNARAVGSRFETDLLAYFRDAGLSAERLAKAGSLDEGDLFLAEADGGPGFTVEAKARRDRNSSLNLHAWLTEAERESSNYARARNLRDAPVPILVVKNPRHKIEDSFVVLRLKDFISGEEDV
jgi:Holliday junction resolvase